MKEQDIRAAHAKIRTIDNTIPSDILQFMNDAAIEKINNRGNTLSDFFLNLALEWQPKIQKSVGIAPYGSSKGDIVEHDTYYDIYRHTWTTKTFAFEGYVIKNILQELKKL